VVTLILASICFYTYRGFFILDFDEKGESIMINIDQDESDLIGKSMV